MLTASSAQIDDPQAAVKEILEQINPAANLLKNSVGIVSCYYEFIDTGVIDMICKSLPFDVIGCTTMGSAINSSFGLEQLSLTVLTSDDITFSTSFSDVLSKENTEQSVKQVYQQALTKLAGEPSLIFVLAPILNDIMGDSMLKYLNAASNGIPIFGTLSNETSMTYENTAVFWNGQVHRRKMAIILMHGKINPRFYTTAISDRNIQKQAAIVTESDGYFLKKINNVPLMEYITSLGVNTYGLAAVTTLPFLVDYGDGSKPVALSMYSLSSEGAYLGGEVPTGTKIMLAEVDYASVIETAETTLRQALEDVKQNGANGIIAIPCFTRCVLLSPNYEIEMKNTTELIGNTVPFFLCYSGGEICPVYNDKKETVNRFHNLTYTVMVF
jgi:hypothetical protein